VSEHDSAELDVGMITEGADLTPAKPAEVTDTGTPKREKTKRLISRSRLRMSCQNCQLAFEVLDLFGLAAVMASQGLCPICQSLSLVDRSSKVRLLELLLVSKEMESTDRK
jgi:tRNA(Ile2) C34 agmatinyltransferase TiaS